MSALAKRLRQMIGQAQGSTVLAGDDFAMDADLTLIPAAVLIAITEGERPGVVLTVRREHLRTHAGQIAFPGGRIDDGEDAIAAALREADEELGLDPKRVTVVGVLDRYRTFTGFDIVPVLGVIPPNLSLAPHEHEVADWFEAPLDFLLDPANHKRRSALFRGRKRLYHEIEWNGRRIWGATAAMIVNLGSRLQWHW